MTGQGGRPPPLPPVSFATEYHQVDAQISNRNVILPFGTRKAEVRSSLIMKITVKLSSISFSLAVILIMILPHAENPCLFLRCLF